MDLQCNFWMIAVVSNVLLMSTFSGWYLKTRVMPFYLETKRTAGGVESEME